MTKSEYAFCSLRDDILSGKLPGNTKLNINQLAKDYGVSTMPIRDAISRLEDLGYVRTIVHIGSWVCEFELDTYFMNMLQRAYSESVAVRILALEHDEKVLSALDEQIKLMEAAISSGDSEAYGNLNRDFHNLINNVSNNATLISLINESLERTRISINIFNWLPTSVEDSIHEHKMLVEALRAGDAALSAKILIYQRCRSNLALLHYMKTTPQENIPTNILRKAIEKDKAPHRIDYFIELFESILRDNMIND